MESLGQKRDGDQRPGLSAFGLGLLSDLSPPGSWEVSPLREPSVQIRSVSAQAIEHSWSGMEAIGWEGVIDGAPFVVERGVAGDHRFVHGAHSDQRGARSSNDSDGVRAVHHLSPDASILQCAPSNRAVPSWWRVVLDSVLFTVALLRGYEALHAGALATPDGAIAITAATGGGKSTLLAELLARGLALMADDVLVLEPQGAHEAPLAHPAPPLMTVPAARIPALRRAGPAETISSLEQERWIAFPVHPEPLPLKALVVLDRRLGLETSLERIEDPLAPLLGSLMSFPHSSERQRTRFELASVLASKIELWRLTADPGTSPDVLANTLLAYVRGSSSRC
jgi:hypothetical protein